MNAEQFETNFSETDYTEEMPAAKATQSEIDVTVTETPAICIVSAIFSSTGFSGCCLLTRFHVSMMTNTSSTPIPEV